MSWLSKRPLKSWAWSSALACTQFCLVAGSAPAVAQLDTLSNFYMPGRFCVFDNSAVGMWHCSGPPQGPAPKPRPDVWGAIAVAPNLRHAMSWNYPNRRAAEAAALGTCNGLNFGRCRTAAIVVDVCAALAVSEPEHLFRISGESGAVNWAEERALLLCRKAGGRACRVTASMCADGKRHELKGETEFHNGNPVFHEEGSSGAFGRH
jgi:hypothetical protein